MNFLINIRVFIKTLNELLLIHLIGSDYNRYKYFSMFGEDLEKVAYLGGKEQIKSYITNRYKMIDGDEEFNSEQKEKIEYLIFDYKGLTNGVYGRSSNIIWGNNTATASQSTISGGWSNTINVQKTTTVVPIK